MAQHPTWLIQAKLRPSTQSARQLARKGIAHLIEEQDQRLILIHAPAGYGKTSAMMQLYDAANTQKHKAVWLSLDEQDSDPLQFFCYLVASCKAAGCDLNFELPPHPQALAQSSLEFFTATLLNALTEGTSPNYIFLDDFHLAESEPTSSIIRRLISGLQNTIFIVSSRTYPNHLETAELTALGRLTEISPRELQFTPEEVDSYFGPLLGKAKRLEYCIELADRTEGWPLALQAIRQLIKKGNTVEDALRMASGRSSLLNNYFIEQVFETLTAKQQHLLLNTAIFDRVNGDLADAVCLANTSWSILDELEKNDVFIHSLDPERQWYRYHNLFAEFLADRARRSTEIDNNVIASRAAKWFHDNNYQREALEYAMLAGDPLLVAKTLESLGGWRLAMEGNLSGVQKALMHISEDVLRQFPTVWMADIYAKLKVGEFDDAASELEQLSTKYALEADVNLSLKNEIGIMRTLLTGYRDEPDRLLETIDFLENMETRAAHRDHYLHAMRYNSLCFFHFRNGELSKSIIAGEASIHHYRMVNSLYGETFIYFHHCYIFYVQGRLRDALATLEQGLELSARYFGKDSDLYAIGAAFGALLAYEQDDFATTQKYLDVALHSIDTSDAWTEVYIVAYKAGLSLAAAKHDWTTFSELHRRAHMTASMRKLPRVSRFADACHDDLVLSKKAPLEAIGLIKRKPPKEENILEFDAFYKVSAYGRFLISEQRYADAIQFLRSHIDDARSRQLNRAFITLSLLCAIAYNASNDVDAASDAFNEVLSFAMFEDFRRAIIDEGKSVVHLIKDIERHASFQRHNRLRDKFLAALIVEINAENEEAGEEETLLSSREKDVLRGLIHGRTNNEISESLGISQNTVKFHLKNLFQKLGVSSRKEAVRLSLRDHMT